MTDEELAALESYVQTLSAPVEADAVALKPGHPFACDCPQCKAGGPKHEKDCRCEDCAASGTQAASDITPAGYTTAEKKPSYRNGWIAVDLDSTLAEGAPPPSIGPPVAAMVDRVKAWLADGEDVRIFTARGFEKQADRDRIEKWCEKHIGQVLPITNVKHAGVREIWDDKAVRVKKDEGEPMHELGAEVQEMGHNSDGKGRQTGNEMPDDEMPTAQMKKKADEATDETEPEGEENLSEDEEKALIDRLAELEDEEEPEAEDEPEMEACDKGHKAGKMAGEDGSTPETPEDAAALVSEFIDSLGDEDPAQEMGGGNPYHAKDGKFTSAGGMKGKTGMAPKGAHGIGRSDSNMAPGRAAKAPSAMPWADALKAADKIRIDTQSWGTTDKLKAVLEYHGRGDFGSVFDRHHGTLGSFAREASNFVPKGKRKAFMRDLVAALSPKSAKAGASLDGAQAASAHMAFEGENDPYAVSLELEAHSNDSNLPPSLRGKNLVQGKPVVAFKKGLMKARDGRVFLIDDLAVASLLADGNSGQIVPFTYQHEKGPQGDENSGYIHRFSLDAEGLKAHVAWTATAAGELAAGKRGPISPDVYIDALHPDTFQTLDEHSPLYAGPGKGRFGTPYLTNVFRPRRWRAVSLVGVAALTDLPIATLSAQQTTSATQPEGKETIVKHEELCQALGLDPANTTPERALAELSATKEKAKTAETMTAELAAKKAADEDAARRKEDAKKAVEEMQQQMAAADRRAKVAERLTKAESDGLITNADRPYWEGKFELSATSAEAELAQLSAKHPGNAHWYEGSRIEPGGIDESLSVDRRPKAERDALLSRAVAFALQEGIDADEFHVSLAAVLSNDKREATFHRQVLAANPNWGREGADKLAITGGGVFRPRLRGSSMKLHPDFDPERANHVLKAFKAGKVDTRVVPEDMQRASLSAAGMTQQMNEASNYQPASRFMVPGLGYGIFQGTFAGSELALEFVGGANEEGSYPISGNEGLRVIVGPSGVPEPIGRNSEAKPSSQRGYDFKKVTLEGYGNTQWVDRRDQAAGDSILPIGVMAQAAADSLNYGKAEKELIQAAFMRDYATHYNTGFYKDLSAAAGRTWNDPNSTPIQDWKGARMAIWRATGSFPDLGLMPPDLTETLSFHPQVLLAAQQAGVSHIDQPRAYAPIEVLLAIFGPLVIPTCRISTRPDGSGADTPWGQDAILAVTSRGKVLAPRAFATVVSAGYPVIRTLSDEKRGLRGSDGADFADMYAMERVGLAANKTSAAYIFKSAAPQLTVVA